MITGAQNKSLERSRLCLARGPDRLKVAARVKAAQQSAIQRFPGNNRRGAVQRIA